MKSLPDYDVVIVGGGMVGASLASALSAEQIRVAVIEAVPARAGDQPSYDDRGLALSLSSQRILAGLGLWDTLCCSPIRHVHVSDRKHFGVVRLHADMLRIPVLGYVVIARELGRVLLDRLHEADNVDFFCPATVEGLSIEPASATATVSVNGKSKTLTSRLIVAADGTHSRVRELLGIDARIKDYGQTAIVTNVTPERPHDDTAYERFTESGPLALLPLPEQRCAVVFTVNTQDAEHYSQMDDDRFMTCLQSRFGRRLGKFQRIGARKSYPVKLVSVREQVRERLVILGNSSHTLHPNGAQGFNLALRDVAGLAEVLIPALRANKDPGERQLLNTYVAARQNDQQCVMQFSDGLATLFYNELPHKVFIRNAGMLFMDMSPPLKRSFLRRAMGIYGRQPSLVRGLAL